MPRRQLAVGAHAARRESFLGAALVAVSLSLSIATDPSDSVSNIAPTILLFVALPFGLGSAMRKRQQDIATLTLEAAALQARADAASMPNGGASPASSTTSSPTR